MARIEKKIVIKASQKLIFDVLTDNINYPKWNLIVEDSKKIEEGKFLVKSKIGEITVIREEIVPNEKFVVKQEGSPLKSVEYNLFSKGDSVEVIIRAEPKIEKRLENVERAGEMFLKSLKAYAEYLESGGNPDNFNKKEILVSH